MKKIIAPHKLLVLMSLIVLATITASAESVTKGGVTLYYDLSNDGVTVTGCKNNTSQRIELKVDGSAYTVNAGGSISIRRNARRRVVFDFPQGSGGTLWTAPKKAVVAEPQPVAVEKPEARAESSEKTSRKKDEPQSAAPAYEQESDRVEERLAQAAGSSSVDFLEMLNRDEFFGADAVSAYARKAEELCKSLEASGDKQQFIIDNDIRQFLEESGKEIAVKKSELPSIAQRIVSDSHIAPERQASTLTLVVETLNSRLRTREEAYGKLNALVSETGADEEGASHGGSILGYAIAAIVVLLLIVLAAVVLKRKKRNARNVPMPASRAAASKNASSDDASIVVRRRTTSILKKQCIDDVVDNPSYLAIDASDFTPDSAVRKIYIKNSCIKDVYNLYAEDLRNTENPKEDGCMVLGRWIHNEADHSYDISLEDVVFPGDDAVFKEYELNFGGKIKLRVAEKLRKLRRDTGLQYDLVCWIHSHPGLGVFFSNSDGNVQEQLKHSQHPNFLVAFVVDILTSNQEMGIFTYRKDGSLNSKGDITKMYSLEDLYKWALQSERNSFSPDKYFNLLGNARLKVNSCNGVEVNNSSVIDLTKIVIEPETGIVGWALGTTLEHDGNQEYVVSSIVRSAEKPGAGVIGCLVSMTHMSFPTIQRMISRYSANLSFVMVYSSKQQTLTTIPVAVGELIPDEQFYGDVNIDDLKIWTRRKR